MRISEPFASGQSIVHSLDPRARVVAAILLSIQVAVSYRFTTLIIGLLSSIILVLLARLNLRLVIRRLMTVAAFLVLIWVVMPLTYEGETFQQFGPIELSRPGVILSAQITLKTLTILMIFMSLVATMTIATLGHALHRLRVPDKFVYLLLITYRYLFVIQEEYIRLRTAIKIRGFQPGTNLHSYKTYAYLIGMLFVRAAMRAERVSQAMRCRGFKGRFYSLDEDNASRGMAIFLGCITAFLFAFAYLEWFFYV